MIQDVVRGADLDPVLLVFLALGEYEALYRQGARRITTAVEEAALQASSIGERVGRERAEQAAIEGTMRKLVAAIEHHATPASERTKQLAYISSAAVIVVVAVLMALALGRIDGAAAARVYISFAQWLPIWGWVVAGFILSEGVRALGRLLTSQTTRRFNAKRPANASTLPGTGACI
jgi:hypothetical protein